MDWIYLVLLFGLGVLIGTVGTLIGVGGGFILVPVLLILNPSLKSEVVTSISLGVVFLNAASGSFAYAKMKRIDYRSAIIFAIATLPGAIIGAFLTQYIQRHYFNLMLGLLLVAISAFLLLNSHLSSTGHKSGKSGSEHRVIMDNKGESYSYSFSLLHGIVLSFGVGFLSSILGIGGGIIHVPALTTLLNFPIHIATATSHFILAIMALAGTLVHIFQGNLKGVWAEVLSIGAGVIVGAQFGAYYSHRIKAGWIIRFLALALLLVGIRLIFMR
jgi:uncharacterized protein